MLFRNRTSALDFLRIGGPPVVADEARGLAYMTTPNAEPR
jgi:hypothetical protein